MDDMQVQRYSTEVKIYIVATVVLAVLIVGLVWWNAAKDEQRRAELKNLYSVYQELGRHIESNFRIDEIKVCAAIDKPAPTTEEGNELTQEEMQAKQNEYNQLLTEHKKQVNDFTSKLTNQYAYLNEHRPSQSNPELMSDALLFRLNKTFNSFTATLQRLGEKCGDLTEDQVNMRKRRYTKTLARFNANLKNLGASNR